MGIKHTILFPTSCFRTMSILVGLELDSGELQVIFCLFRPVGGGFYFFFFPSCKADGEMVILET